MSALNEQVGGDHYKRLKIQPVEYIHANGIPFIEGSVIKYLTRWRSKGGVADLEKAKHLIDLLIELEGRRPTPAPAAVPSAWPEGLLGDSQKERKDYLRYLGKSLW